jgi:hypothetical protein
MSALEKEFVSGESAELARFQRGERAAMALEMRPMGGANVLCLVSYLDGKAHSGVTIARSEAKLLVAALGRVSDLLERGAQ